MFKKAVLKLGDVYLCKSKVHTNKVKFLHLKILTNLINLRNFIKVRVKLCQLIELESLKSVTVVSLTILRIF